MIGPRRCPTQLPGTALSHHALDALDPVFLLNGKMLHSPLPRGLLGAPDSGPNFLRTGPSSCSNPAHQAPNSPPPRLRTPSQSFPRPGLVGDSSALPSKHSSDALGARAEWLTCLWDALYEGSAECAEEGWQSLPAGRLGSPEPEPPPWRGRPTPPQ